MSRIGEENVGGILVGGKPFMVDVALGMSRWQVRIDTNDSLLFASEADVDRMVELLQRARKRAAERNEELVASFDKRRDA